jgi:uncharacterized membrane protein
VSDRLATGALVATTVGCGLVTGLLLAFSVCVMSALGRLPAAHGAAAMQTINVAIQNPVFGLVFAGATAGSAYAAASALLGWGQPGTAPRLFGGVLFLVGVLVLTLVRNLPLNDALAAVDPQDPAASAVWEHYLRVWTSWNHVRVVAGTVATALLVLSLRSPIV